MAVPLGLQCSGIILSKESKNHSMHSRNIMTIIVWLWLIQSLFFSPAGSRPLVPSGSLLAASASSSQASSTGFSAIMLLWESVKDSNLGQQLYSQTHPTCSIRNKRNALESRYYYSENSVCQKIFSRNRKL